MLVAGRGTPRRGAVHIPLQEVFRARFGPIEAGPAAWDRGPGSGVLKPAGTVFWGQDRDELPADTLKSSGKAYSSEV